MTLCSYGHFRDFYRSTIVGALGVDLRFDLWALGGFQFGTFKLYVVGALGVFSIGVWALRRSRRQFSAVTRTLNVFVGALLVISMSRILWSEIAGAAIPSSLSDEARDSLAGSAELARGVSSDRDTGTLPNIYYLVLDSYASAQSLHTYYDFDNSNFLAALEKRRFYVASQSRSNYAFTSLSIPSTLNMKYLNHLSDDLGVTSTDFKPVYDMVRRNVVMELLQSYGYHTMVISSGYAVTSSHVFADTTITCKRSIADDQFVELCLNVSVLGEILTHYSMDRKREEILCQFEAVRNLSRTPGPHFVFAHILSPHYPYIFDENGGPVSNLDHVIDSKDQLYVDQLQFVNGAVMELVDDILANTDRELVMVLQADHGPWDIGPTSGVEGQRNRMRIFNSYLVSEEAQHQLYPDITPVNTFRLIFKTYFDQDLELVEDRCYYSDNPPYQFVDVTDAVAYQ